MQPSIYVPPPGSGYGSPGAPAPDPVRRPGGQKPEIGRVFNETMQEFMRDLGPYALAGLGFMVVAMGLALVIMLLYGAVIMVAVIADSANQASGGSGEAMSALVLVGMSVGIIGLVLVLSVVSAAFYASLLRGIAAHQRGEAALGFGTAFSTARQRLGASVGVTVAVMTLSVLGALFCYVPGLIVAFLLLLASPLVMLHGLPVGAALRRSAREVRSDLGWYLRFFLVYLLVTMVAQYVPVIGPMFPIALLVRVYREIAGDGPEPVLPSG
ncbi:MAG: hypothetical protein JW751_16730 [Polyangiaceae bacterium]|nr:hypothetical protein [Polyangiaceae bacterium]